MASFGEPPREKYQKEGAGYEGIQSTNREGREAVKSEPFVTGVYRKPHI